MIQLKFRKKFWIEHGFYPPFKLPRLIRGRVSRLKKARKVLHRRQGPQVLAAEYTNSLIVPGGMDFRQMLDYVQKVRR